MGHRTLGHAQQPVVVEIILFDASVHESNGLIKRRGHAELKPAADLRIQPEGIDGHAAIDRGPNTMDGRQVLRRQRNFHNNGNIRASAAMTCQSPSAPRGRFARPCRQIGNRH
jgi:hypothetical protein